MLTCEKCKTQADDEAKFCLVCGNSFESEVQTTPSDDAISETVFCTGCGKKTSSEVSFCPNCGKAINGKTNEPKAKTASEKFSTKDLLTKASGLFSPKKALVIGGILFLLILTVFLAPSLFKNKSKASILFLKDNELNFTYLSNIKPFEITNKFVESSNNSSAIGYANLSKQHDALLFSGDGRYVFYPNRIESNGMATYYYRDLTVDNTKSDVEKKIDSEIKLTSTIRLTKDAPKFFYIKGSDNRLYMFNMKEKKKIDNDVLDYYINENGSYAVYSKEDGTIYEIDLASKDLTKSKIDSDASIHRVLDNLSKIIYSKDGSLFLKEKGEDRVKISSNVDKVISIIDAAKMYYTKTETLKFKPLDYVIDDLLESDKTMIAPIAPNSSDFTEEIWIEPSWWSSGYWDVQTDYDKFNIAQREYENKRAEYNIKLKRDQLREELANNEVEIDNTVLYYYDGSKETVVADSILSIIASTSKNNALAYTKYNRSDINKVKLNDLDSAGEMNSIIYSAQTASSDSYILYADKETSLDTSNSQAFAFNNSGKSLYYLDDYSNEKSYGELMSISFEKGAASAPVKIDEDVSSYRFGNNSDALYYFKDVKDEVGDVYKEGKSIASDVLISSIYNFKESSTILYFADYNTDKNYGTLYIMKNDKTTMIADDVNSFVAENETAVAYLTDYNSNRQKGDAFIYTGAAKPAKLDTDVSALVWKYDDIDSNQYYTNYEYYSTAAPKAIPTSIIGKWSDVEYGYLIEFKSDGTVIADGESTEYRIVGNKLFISFDDEEEKFNYAIEDDKLILYDDYDSYVYEKIY